MKQRWDALAKRLRRNRSEACILARLDELEAHILSRLAELEVHIAGRLEKPAPIPVPEASIPLNSISVPIDDGQRTVEFQGVELSQRFYGEGLKRITETLYGTGPGQYLVHTRTLHRGKGLRTEYTLHEIGDDDLEENGQYAALGRLRLPVTMEEALKA